MSSTNNTGDQEKMVSLDVPTPPLINSAKNQAKALEDFLIYLKKGMNNLKETLSLVNLSVERSCVISISNHTSQDLQLIKSLHYQGGFSVLPPDIVKSNTTVEFTSKSKAMLIGKGTKGSVTYRSVGLEIKISWKNLFFGSNDCEITLAGPDCSAFRGSSTPGIGYKQVSMHYALFEMDL